MIARSDTFEREAVRIYFVAGIMLAMILFLMGALFRVQVAHGEKYERDLRRQSIRRVRLPGTRGMILDRNGVCLAGNRPSYCIAIYIEELRQSGRPGVKSMVRTVRNLVSRLAERTGLEPRITARDIENHLARRSPLPLLAWRDVDERVRAVLAENSESFPGVDLYVEPVREYPFGALAAHVLGYVGRADPETDEGEEPFHYYLPEMEGRRGLEKVLDSDLKGKAGGQLIRVNASGMKHALATDREEAMVLEPVRGSDVRISLDSRVQRLVEANLAGEVGAVVVLDPRTGEVLAMASSPSFDPNEFACGISLAAWNSLSCDTNAPLLNRAAMGRYSPGSLFKPIVAIAALEKRDGIDASTEYSCPGYYDMGRAQLRCWNWKQGGHGVLAMRKAIEQSCNTYFCSLGVKCGYPAISETARRLGLGEKTGMELDAEGSGNIPASRTIRSRGDLANVSVGQGAVETTPIQMASVCATIASGGRKCGPLLVLGKRAAGEKVFKDVPSPRHVSMGWRESTMRTVRGGMRDVVESPVGTGKRAGVEGIAMGGKTGTAEFGSEEEERKRGWMMVFAPFDEPRYAIAMVIENAVSGGMTVAPKIKAIVAGILALERAGNGSG